MIKVESFELDHTKVKAPYVRKAAITKGKKGDTVTKFDLRFTQPNKMFISTAAIHTLEHLLAGYMREEMDEVIDISPMGCRTGFYMICWGEPESRNVAAALRKSLEKVMETKEIAGAFAISCGNYRDHSLPGAKEYAELVLRDMIDSW
jgi:S-ribosylhomocysteine lyase